MPIGKIEGVRVALVDQIADDKGDMFVQVGFDASTLAVQYDASIIYITLERDDDQDIVIKLAKPQVKELVRLLVERL